jgi:hypothetical protein
MIYIASYISIIAALYTIVGWKRIWKRILMYGEKKYWTDYNIIELAAWMAKAVIIVPGLIFGIELWYFHFLTLLTSSLLIWASMRKDLPTLIVFNTLWVIISTTIIVRNLIQIFG